MRTAIKETTVYKFEELSEKAQETALSLLLPEDIDWAECAIEDAKNIGLIFTKWDIERRTFKSSFIDSALETAHAIEKEQGESCETFKTTKKFLQERDSIIEAWPKDENGEFENVYDLDEKLDTLETEYRLELSGDYFLMLQKQYEYRCSKEYILELIEINGYEFTENGKIY